MKPSTEAETSPNGHTHAPEAAAGIMHCPTCDQAITQEKFAEIRRRIEAEDRRQAEAMEERLAQVRLESEAKAVAEVAGAKEAATAEIAAVKEATNTQIQGIEARKIVELAAARDEATKAANEAAEAKVKEAESKAKAAAAELEAAKKGHAEELATAKTEATNAANEVAADRIKQSEGKAKTAVAELEELKKNQHETLKLQLAEQREVLEEDKQKAIQQVEAARFKENQGLQTQVERLNRKLERKTSDELGEGAEIDLFETLKAEFPDDKITRIKKGEPGADIRHEVIAGRESCGVFLYDSKNRNAWRNDFVEKLRSDQLAAKAHCAFLSTRVFPAGKSQICLQSDVIVVNPARTVAVVTLLRGQLIQMHTKQLSDHEREEKMALIYAFITSDRFAQLLRRMEELTDELLELDVKEQKAHKGTWAKRGTITKSLQRAQGQLTTEVEQIISLDSSSDVADAG